MLSIYTMQRSISEQIDESRLRTILSFNTQTIQDLTGLKEDHLFIIRELWDIALSVKPVNGIYHYDVYLSSKPENPKGRMYPEKGKYSYARNPCKLLRNYLLPDGCKSYDLVSAETQIIHKIAKKLEIETPTTYTSLAKPHTITDPLGHTTRHNDNLNKMLETTPPIDTITRDY